MLKLKAEILASLMVIMLILSSGMVASTGPASSGWAMYRGDPMGHSLSHYSASDNSGNVDMMTINGNVEAQPAMAPDGTLYIPASPYAIIAVKDGEELWHFPESAYDNIPHVNTPVIDSDGNIYFGVSTESRFYSLRPDGSINWACDLPVNVRDGFSPAVMDSQGNLYFGTDFNFYSISPSGDIRWSFTGSSYVDFTMPVVAGSTVYFPEASPNSLYYNASLCALDKDTGELLWKWGETPFLGHPSVISNGTVFIRGSDSSSNAYLFAVSNNRTLFKMRIGDSSQSDPAIDASGNIYIAGYFANQTSCLYVIHYDEDRHMWLVKNRFWLPGNAGPMVLDTSGNIFVLSYGTDGPAILGMRGNGAQMWNALLSSVRWMPLIAPDGSMYAVQDGYAGIYHIGATSEGGSDDDGGTDTGDGSGDDGSGDDGGDASDSEDNPDGNPSSTPGFGAFLFFTAIGAVMLMRRRKSL